MKSSFIFLILSLLIISCKTNTEQKPVFEHDVKRSPTPWTSDSFELEEDDFTFAIISDLAGGEGENIYSTSVDN